MNYETKKEYNLKHISQEWFLIEIISAYKDKWQFVGQSFTHSPITNLSWNKKWLRKAEA